MWKHSQWYSKVPEETVSQDELASSPSADDHFEENRRFSRLINYRATFFLVIGVLVIILSGQLITSQLRNQATKSKPSTPSSSSLCGNTTSQARSRGCEFDLLSYSWLPPQCLDRETSAEFRTWILSPDRSLGSWPFFTNDAFTSQVPNEDALSERILPLMTYTTWEEHLGHCVFLARRIYRSMNGSFGMDPHFGNYGHTVHCTDEVLKGIKEDQEGNPKISWFGVYFGTC